MIKQLWNKAVLWFVAKAFAFLIALTAGIFGRRMSHNKGTSFKGKVKITDNPTFPPNEFFQAGKEFPCRVRFASVSFEDSEMPQVRSASIKFSHHNYKSPFDISMNTGKIALFNTASNFFFFASKRKAKKGIQYPAYYEAIPIAIKSAQDTMRISPESFSKLYYYSKTPTLFHGKDGKQYYCTYRMTPENPKEPETGVNPEYLQNFRGNCRVPGTETQTLDAATLQDVAPYMKPKERHRNYLEQEIGNRLKDQGKITMQFQIQIREATDNDDPEIFNCMKYWAEEEFPFHQLATVELFEECSYEDNQSSAFSSSHYPPSLGIIPAKSIYDYNSIVYLRAHDGLAAKTRLLSYKWFGVPKRIADHGPRNRMFNEYE